MYSSVGQNDTVRIGSLVSVHLCHDEDETVSETSSQTGQCGASGKYILQYLLLAPFPLLVHFCCVPLSKDGRILLALTLLFVVLVVFPWTLFAPNAYMFIYLCMSLIYMYVYIYAKPLRQPEEKYFFRGIVYRIL